MTTPHPEPTPCAPNTSTASAKPTADQEQPENQKREVIAEWGEFLGALFSEPSATLKR